MSTTQYGIGVTKNRFELFDIDDEDPLEVLKLREQEKEARKKTKLSEKENKGKDPTPKPKISAPRKGIKETQNLKPLEGQKNKEDLKTRPTRIEKTDRKFVSSDIREDRNNRRNREERPISEFQPREDRGERFERRDYRGPDRNSTAGVFFGEGGGDSRGRGRGGLARGGFTRGGRGGRGSQRPTFDVRGKREYDRQSGSDKTGVKHVDKREGAGAHNWGNLRDDLVELQNVPVNDETSWSPEKIEDTPPETNGTTVEGEEPPATTAEDELKELTLDEWKALKTPRQKPNYNIRKAGEGEDLTQWKKMYALQKKKDGDEEEEEDDEEYENCDYPQRVGRQKHVLDIDIHFKDTRGGVRGRGGRGLGRGGPRMGLRGPTVVPEKVHIGRDILPKIAPKVDDEHDFPSLG